MCMFDDRCVCAIGDVYDFGESQDSHLESFPCDDCIGCGLIGLESRLRAAASFASKFPTTMEIRSLGPLSCGVAGRREPEVEIATDLVMQT